VHARAWRLELPSRQSDFALYAVVLLALYGLILLLLVQLTELKGSASWVEKTLALGWAALLAAFFVWAPWRLTHRQLARRDLLPGAILTAVGLVALMLISRYVMQFWVDLYAKDYGGLGVVLAIYFWLAFSSAAIVWSASISPALAERREYRRLLATVAGRTTRTAVTRRRRASQMAGTASASSGLSRRRTGAVRHAWAASDQREHDPE
jgi:membrane protein